MKTTSKLAWVIIAASTLIISLLAVATYYFIKNYSYTDFYKRLETRARITGDYYFEVEGKESETYQRLREKYLETLNNEAFHIVEVNSDSGKSIIKQLELPSSFIQLAVKNGKNRYQRNTVFFEALKYVQHGKTYLVILSAENYYAENHLKFIRYLLVGIIIIMALVVTLLFYYFTKNIFDPITKVTNKVKAISTENIHERLEKEKNSPEIDALIATFNDLLSRLETAFQSQNNFISNASHEYGTPLTAIIGEAEITLKKDRTQEEYKEALTSILTHAERINTITQSLLLLAQIGYNNRAIDLTILRCDDLVLEAATAIEKLHPKARINLDFNFLPENSFKLKVNGNRQLLLVALGNIINNACKYSNYQIVTVSVASSDQYVNIKVIDTGIGIPVEDLPYIYDPFFKAKNAKRFEGYGIGLPLTRNIIHLHKGELAIDSQENKGSLVHIKLPIAKIPQ